MSAVEILALALMGSILLSGFILFAAPVAERVSDDPHWRDRFWSVAFWMPVAAPLLTALFLLLPTPPAEPVAVAAGAMFKTGTASAAPAATVAAATPALWIDGATVAVAALAAAGLLSLLRLGRLVLRTRRLARLIAAATPASPELTTQVEARVSRDADEAFLAGLRRPVLVLPEALIAAEGGTLRAVIDHELAHLRRRDLTALWLEEAARVVMAGNPLLPMLHARRALAREEACDALALSGASTPARRLYARALIDALRHRAEMPAARGLALTFTGTQGKTAMRRIKSVLDPRPAAGRLTRRLSLAAALAVGGVVCAGSLALAGQREAERPTNSETAAAIAGRSSEEQAALERRYRGLSAEGFRNVCASADAADEGYCAGVMIAQMYGPEAAVCGPDDSDREALRTYIEAGKAAMAHIEPRTDEGALGYAERVAQQTFPCPAGGAVAFNAGGVDLDASPPAGVGAPPRGGGRLWVRFDGDDMQTYQGDRVVLTLSGQAADGKRYEHVSEAATGPNGELPDAMFVDLTRDYFPSLGERRAYELSARIRRGDRVIYVSDVSTIRLAPGAQGSLGRLRPVLEMRPA